MNKQCKQNKKFQKSQKFQKGTRFIKDKNKVDSTDGQHQLGDSNDFKWYNLNPDLVAKAAKIPFGRPLGNTISIRYELVKDVYDSAVNQVYSIPGIVSLWMIPSIGCSTEGVQSIDVAAKSIYSWVRHANSGHTNYDSPDLMLYLMACANIYSAAGFLLKTYSCINSYNPTNRYMPRALLESMGWNPDLLIENIADFRYFCAQWFKKAQVLYTPKNFPYFEKAFWMYTQVFEEDSTGKSPLYQYVPKGFYRFNPTKYTNGGCLEFLQMPTPLLQTWNGMQAYFSSLLDVLIDNEDIGIMAGDIKKAFGDNLWSLGEFPYDASIQVVKDSFVLQQMHNTTPLNINRAKLDIVQDLSTNSLACFPEIEFISDATHRSYAYNTRIGGSLLDIDSSVPSEEEVIEATQYFNTVVSTYGMSGSRYTNYLSTTGYTHANNSYTVLNSTDFICGGMEVIYIKSDGTLDNIRYSMGSELIVADSSETKGSLAARLARLSTFEWLPAIVINDLPIVSMHNYTVTTSDVIDNLHDCTWLSLLAIPANQHLR